jgi:hypothetical protein
LLLYSSKPSLGVPNGLVIHHVNLAPAAVFDDLHKLTMIFSVEEIDMLHHDKLNSSFMIFIPIILMKRGNNSRKIDVLRY